MRTLAIAVVLAAVGGCSEDPVSSSGGGPDGGGGGGGADASPVPTNGFRVESPEIVLAPSDEKTFCYYTTLSNTTMQGVKRWTSSMTPGSHHLILFFTASAQQPDGTLTEDCGFGDSISNAPVWAYAASNPEADFAMPEGIGMAIQPQQHLFVQMHYLNTTDGELHAHVRVDGETFAEGESFTQAYAFVTYNTEIDVAAGQTGEVSGSCDVPSGAKFFTMSTHAHQFNTRATVKDGSTMLVETTDWEHPDVARWNEEPFFSFQGPLLYHCEYDNTSGARVQTGDSARTDEMCMAVGYFFPATRPVLCLNSFVVPF